MVHPGDDEKKQVPIAEIKPDSWIGSKITLENSSGDDVVTITKSQLQAILEAIKQVGSLNINDKASQLEKLCYSEKNETADGAACSALGDVQSNGSVQVSSSKISCPLDQLLPISRALSCSESQLQLSPTKLSHLSKVEQKRLQWEKEKAEMLEWNPWGKPGGGAPTRKALPVASVAPRTDNRAQMVHTYTVPYSSSVPNNLSSCITSPKHAKNILNAADQCNQSQDSPFHSKHFVAHNFVTQPVKPVPTVFKSSIAFGPVEDDTVASDGTKDQWMKDLDSQREEQRLHLMANQEHHNSMLDAEPFENYKNDLDSISISLEGIAAPHGGNQADGRIHARGQGFKLDPEAAAVAEERRHKAQEWQQALRVQMEEKQQRLQEEKERKRKEEEEEEQRLAMERAQMQAEYELEQQRRKEKMEMEEKKQNALLSAVRDAQEQAEASKRSKKAQKLQSSGNSQDVTNNLGSSGSPKKPINAVLSPRAQPKGDEHKKRNEENLGNKASQQTATVRPIQTSSNEFQQKGSVAKDESSYSREIGIQTIPLSSLTSEDHSGYITNRVITPPSLRIRARRSHGKDFGTQTDINYGKWIDDDYESTDQSNTSSIRHPVGKRLTRVQHSKPYKASRHQLISDAESTVDRPKWGVNQPSKSFIRMTDRDPHFTKRKKLQELRKQHWEREMAAQQMLRNARRSTGASYPSLRNRRIRSSSEGTPCVSSSEFETSHMPGISSSRHHHGYGYCSECGSAEDFAYLEHSSTYSSTHLPSMRGRRYSQSSDNLPSIIGGSEPTPSRLNERFSFPDMPSCSGSLPPVRRKWHSQDTFPHAVGSIREPSPPVPALQSRLTSGPMSNSLMSPAVHSRRKWSDQESFDLESVALSRAQTQKSASEDGSDMNEKDSVSSADSSKRGKTPTEQNPLVCPEVVTGRPTPRQDRILQNLSSLRQGLMQKQKELENMIRRPSNLS